MPSKNLMEDKKLDFSQPLMSVRRFSSTGTEEKKRSDESSEPKIPPLAVHESELKSGPVRNPGTVPFQWEKIPGKPKDETKPPPFPFKKPPVSPKPPPGRNSNAKNGVPINQTEIYEKGGKGDNDRKKRERKESLDSGESDEAYMDAPDTLSRTESFFINCSFSGLSELDSADSKQFETFSTDLQTRDFMIRRFLPAARAMASETPQHPIKKQIAQQDPAWELQKVARGAKQQLLLNSYEQTVSTHYAHDIGSDEYDNEDNNSLCEYSSAKICSLLPRFCLLNPIPAMKTPAPPRATSVHRLPSVSSHVSSSNAVNGKESATDFRNEKLKSKGQTYRDNPKTGNRNSEGLTKQNAIIAGASEKDMASLDSHRRCFREFLENDPDLCSAIVEKTLYIDAVHKLNSPKSNSCCSDNSKAKISDVNEAPLVDTSVLENSNVLTANNDPKSLKRTNGMTIESDSQCPLRSKYRSSKENSDKAMDLRNQFLKGSNGGRPHFPLAPPLPKSPSESWLKRTLQTVPRSSSSFSSHLSATCMAAKMNSYDPKWDGNVKTAQNGHGNKQFSEVLLATIPEV